MRDSPAPGRIDPATEIPPLGLVTFRQHWRPPFVYSDQHVEELMAQVSAIVPTPPWTATFQTMIGLFEHRHVNAPPAVQLVDLCHDV